MWKICKPPFGNFKVGYTIKSLTETRFIGGGIHLKGARYTIQTNSLSYYNVIMN
jgi:hypothetical protein